MRYRVLGVYFDRDPLLIALITALGIPPINSLILTPCPPESSDSCITIKTRHNHIILF